MLDLQEPATMRGARSRVGISTQPQSFVVAQGHHDPHGAGARGGRAPRCSRALLRLGGACRPHVGRRHSTQTQYVPANAQQHDRLRLMRDATRARAGTGTGAVVRALCMNAATLHIGQLLDPAAPRSADWGIILSPLSYRSSQSDSKLSIRLNLTVPAAV